MTLYVGTSGPVDIWVIGSSRLLPAKAIKLGRTASVTSALAVDRKAKTVTGFPAYAWSGRSSSYRSGHPTSSP